MSDRMRLSVCRMMFVYSRSPASCVNWCWPPCRMQNLYVPGGPEDRLMQVVRDQLHQQRIAPLASAMPRDKRIRKVVEALLSDPADNRGFEDWSRFAGASQRTLARLFQSETGMTFRAWRQQLRLQRAPKCSPKDALSRQWRSILAITAQAPSSPCFGAHSAPRRSAISRSPEIESGV
jgi:AraC-like DNA-binding protein